MWLRRQKTNRMAKKIQAVMNSGTKTVYLDIMKDGAFYQQIPYSYCPLWPVDVLKIQKYVLDKMPSLCGHKFTIALTNNRVR